MGVFNGVLRAIPEWISGGLPEEIPVRVCKWFSVKFFEETAGKMIKKNSERIPAEILEWLPQRIPGIKSEVNPGGVPGGTEGHLNKRILG